MTVNPIAGSIDPDKPYSYAEGAELFGVTERRFRRWVEEGKLDYVPLPGGRGRRVTGAQLLAYLEKSAVKAEA